jgi:hypothetical protein
MTDWKPWDLPMPPAPSMPIDAPPCSHCVYWKPQAKPVQTQAGVKWSGVILCHAMMMHHDFSCFESRE